MDASGPDRATRHLAERRLLAALRSLHRREPLRPDVRVDALLAAARERPRAAGGHRGSRPLELDDAALLAVINALAADGRVVRDGRRVRLAEHAPDLGPEMRARVDRLLAGLREAGASPPRVDGIAARLGIPPPVVEQLRVSGELVAIAPGIDYPRDAWEEIGRRIERVIDTGPLTVARVRDQLRTSRRHAEAILAHRRAAREKRRPGRPKRPPGPKRPRSPAVRSRRRGG